MKNIQKRTLLIVALTTLLFNNYSSAQDVYFSQPYANPLKLNPAMMGWNTDMKIALQYRNQWALVDKGFTTYAFSAMYPIFLNEGKSKLDIGFNAFNDKYGAFNNYDFSLSIGYALQISDAGNLSFALTGGYVQKALDIANLTFDKQYVSGAYDASNPNNATNLTNEPKAGYVDVGFGLLWFYNPADDAKINTYLGVSGFHLNQPNETMLAGSGMAPRKYSFQGGVKIIGDNGIDVTPNVIFTTQNGNEQIAVGSYVDYNFNEKAKIILGGWYRRNNGAAFSLGFEHKSFTIGYSYDLPTSGISAILPGANASEVTLSYKLDRTKSLKTNPSIY